MKSVTRSRGLQRVSSVSRRPLASRAMPGMTLIELAVVILFLLLFATLLMTGAKAFKRGSDRSGCIMNLQAVQKAVRGYGNMSGLNPGQTALNLEAQVIGTGLFFEELPKCPAGGTYTLGGNQIPDMGTLYMSCSLNTAEGHIPDNTIDW